MSGTSVIPANSPGQNTRERLFNFQLPSPAIVVGLLLSCVFLLRLPIALLPRELNVDEGQALSQAMKFLVDPRPWKAVDSGTWGPLNSYFISLFLLMGFKPNYILLHVIASLLVCLQILVVYLALLKLTSNKIATLGGLLMVLMYGLDSRKYSLSYAGELLPTLLLMLGYYLFEIWLIKDGERHSLSQLYPLLLSGVVLGAAPWCKLQSAPIAVALFVMVLVAIFKSCDCCSRRSQVTAAALFSFGLALTTLVFLSILIICGSLTDFWKSYILQNLGFAGGLNVLSIAINCLTIAVISPLNQLLFSGVGLLLYVSQLPESPAPTKRQKWIVGGLLVYGAAAFLAIGRVRYLFPHHAMFVIPPMTCILALLADRAVAGGCQRRQYPHKTMALLLLVLLGAAGTIYVAYGVQYIRVMNIVRGLATSEVSLTEQNDEAVLESRGQKENSGLARVLMNSAGPSRWVLQNSNERILAAVRKIEKSWPIRSLSIWGYAPGVYVLIGIPPATRESCTYFSIAHGPLQFYFRNRYLGDLREKPPDLFIDAVSKGALLWGDMTEDDGYESDPQLRKFIDDNYVLVDELTLVKGTKPVRFFARHYPAS